MSDEVIITEVGPDEVLATKSGELLTHDDIEALADEAEAGYDLSKAKPIGRPSLSGLRIPSPRVSFRVPDDVRIKAHEVASREGKSVSQLAREALERYLAAS